MGKRREPLMLAIGTQSPSPINIMSELVDYAGRVNSGEIVDTSFHGQVYAVPDDADSYDPEYWKLANPAQGIFVSEQQLAAAAERERRMPTYETEFRTLNCKRRVDADQKAHYSGEGGERR